LRISASKRKEVLVIDNTLEPQIETVGQFLQKKWPGHRMLFVVKKIAYVNIKDKTINSYHLYRRQHPCSLSQGLGIALRLKRMKPNAILIRKHDLTLKFFLMIILCRSADIYLWKNHPGGGPSLQRISRLRLLVKPYNKSGFLISLVFSLIPLLLLAILSPLLWLVSRYFTSNKEIWSVLKHNLQQGPMGDSPLLWASLQLVMCWSSLYRKPVNIKQPRRILIIRTDHIGDAINTVPLVRHLRNTYPDAHITILCDTGYFLWKDCPYINEVLVYKTNNRLFNRTGRKLRYIFRPFSYARVLRKRNFDLVLDCVGRTETHILSYFCTSAVRLSQTYYPYQLFGITIVCQHYESALHETKRVLSFVKPTEEIADEDCALEIWLKPEIKKQTEAFFAKSGIDNSDLVLGIHPGAVSLLRVWPIERFAEVACKLGEKYNMKILFFEPPDNPGLSEQFISLLSECKSDATVVKDIDLLTLAGLISRSNLFLCNDSGPMHIAAATKTPMVAIFGPGEYFRWRPQHPASAIVRKTMSCSPCSQNDCTDSICISQVESNDVLRAAEKVLFYPS
jgi:ADP-heptose:LPS heptosyltransferase